MPYLHRHLEPSQGLWPGRIAIFRFKTPDIHPDKATR